MNRWPIESVKASLFAGMLDELAYIDGRLSRDTFDRVPHVIDHLQQYAGWADIRAIREELWTRPPFSRWIQDRVRDKRVSLEEQSKWEKLA